MLSLQGREKKMAMPCTEASLENFQELLLLKCNLMLRCPKQSNSLFATDVQGEEMSWSILLIPEQHLCKVLIIWHLSQLFYCYFRWFFHCCQFWTVTVSPGGSVAGLCYPQAKLAVDTTYFPISYSFPVKFYHYFAYIKDNQAQMFDTA